MAKALYDAQEADIVLGPSLIKACNAHIFLSFHLPYIIQAAKSDNDEYKMTSLVPMRSRDVGYGNEYVMDIEYTVSIIVQYDGALQTKYFIPDVHTASRIFKLRM